MRAARLGLAVVFSVSPGVIVAAQVLTSQYDNARTGAALNETVLTPSTVSANRFGKVFVFHVDGDVYAQPLYVPHVEIPGKGAHDVVFVATEHDSVYAFDAAGRPAEPLWHVNFLDTSRGITTLSDGNTQCPFISPEIGITPTPVIDPKSGTLYVLARTRQRSALSRTTYSQQLHALAITTGVEKFGGPVEIQAPGFDPLRELPRAGLLLTGGRLYLTWASSCDVGPYHGWVMTYDASTLKQTAVLNVSPDGSEAGIWQSDNAPAADSAGHVYVATGNGTFDAASGGRDYGDSLLKLTTSRGQLAIDDFFTPPDQSELAARDLDLGSGGPLLVPGADANGGLVLLGGKDGKLRTLDRDRLGHGKTQAPQVIQFKGGIYSAPAYWNGRVYVLASSDTVKAFAVASGRLSATPVDVGTQVFPNPGATPAISASGTRDGILWMVQTKVWNDFAGRPAVLRAFDALHLARELYSSETNSARDRAGAATRFAVPTIANGRVYVGVKGEVDVYGAIDR